MGSSKLLPVVGILFIFGLVFIAVKAFKADSSESIRLPGVKVLSPPDHDSPADTIRTLTAKVAEISRQNESLVKQNDDLIRHRREIKQQVTKQVSDQLRRDGTQGAESPEVGRLGQRFELLQTQLETLMATQDQDQTSTIPLGLGLDDLSGTQPAATSHWVEPLDTTYDQQGNPVYPSAASNDTSGSLLHANQTRDDQALPTFKAEGSSAAPDNPLEPHYTVPRNATLVGSTGMTALIGRIPRDGQVQDPFPFKVIVGADNLAANGIEIPGIDGMIFSGTASGDWALSCVRGSLHSVTYVFTDGTIRSVSSDDNSLQNLSRERGDGTTTAINNRPLGWLSDRRGIPCVSGKRISNAVDYLAGRLLARAVESGGQAFSQNEVTNQTGSALGVTTSVITGDAAKFAGLNALSGSANELSEYLRERAAQSFDVVYVDTGVELAIHVDVELPIDFNPKGRLTTYAHTTVSDQHALD